MSKITDDIIKQIQDEIDRRGGNVGSLEELNKIAAEINDRHNLTPQPDFEDLSPVQCIWYYIFLSHKVAL
jgi:hypothetical protein